LLEKLARRNRKRIPELIVHAKDSTAYGTMTVPASTAQLGISGPSGALTFGKKAAGDGLAR
jgi:catalase